jgi:hypothetical protein
MAPAPALAEAAAGFYVRVACAFAPLATQTDVPARAEALLRELRATLPSVGGVAVLRAAVHEAERCASLVSLALALRVVRDALVNVPPAALVLVDEPLLETLCTAVEDGLRGGAWVMGSSEGGGPGTRVAGGNGSGASAGSNSAEVVEQGLAAVNNALVQMALRRRGRGSVSANVAPLQSRRLMRRLLTAASQALGGAGAGVNEQAARVLLQLASDLPLVQVDVAAALVADHGILGRAARAVRGAARGGGLRGPPSQVQGAAVHTLRLLSTLALSSAICLPSGDGSGGGAEEGGALLCSLDVLRGVFAEDEGTTLGAGDADPREPAPAVYVAAGELVARLLALDNGDGAGLPLRTAALALGDALEAWFAPRELPPAA